MESKMKLSDTGVVFATLAFLLMSVQFSFAETAQEVSSLAGIFVSNQTMYLPYPAEPGKYIDLWVRIQYLGGGPAAEEVACALEPAYPFSVEEGDELEKNVGTLSKYQEALLKFRVRIDANAVTGSNNLRFKCMMKSVSWSYTDLPVYIQAHDAIIAVGKVGSTPSEFEPGQAGKVEITLENVANVLLKDITVKLDLTAADMPFAPVNATTEKRIQSVPVGRQQEVTFDIVAFPDAELKIYKIPLVLTYYDELGKNYSKESIISLTVASKPDVLVVHEQTEVVKNEAKNSITLSIVNRGASQIRFVTAKLGQGTGYAILSPTEVYAGNINSDDSETATYDLFINSTTGTVSLPITLSYRDASEREYTEQRTVQIRAYTKEEAIALGFEKAAALDPLLIAGAGIIGLYVLYRIVGFIFRKK